MELGVELLLFLFFIATLSGVIDAMVGGGGLLTLPALMMTGLPPLAALGTNKLQGLAGALTAAVVMFKKRLFTLADIMPLLPWAFAGGLFGAIVIQALDSALLAFVTPMVLLMISIYFLLTPTNKLAADAKDVGNKSRFHKYTTGIIGAYDGGFGPGTGSFFTLNGVELKGLSVIKATAQAKPLNAMTNLVSFGVFFYHGQFVWQAGLLMLVGQIIGASFGSALLVKVKPIMLKLLIVLASSAMLAKYVWTLL